MNDSPPIIAEVSDALRTHYWSWLIYETTPTSNRLLSFLVHQLPHIDPSTWKERFDFGGVYVNGRDALGDRDLPLPCKVEYYEPKFKISEAGSIFPNFRDDYVIYGDEHLVAVYKPPGLSSMPAKEQRHFSVKASVERHLGVTVHMPSRLDVSAQGLMIMSSSACAHARLQQAFEHREVFKEYRCASTSESPWISKSVELPIGRDSRHPVLRRVDYESGKPAKTEFIAIGAATSGDLPVHVFRAIPITGRTHQIRVHASASGISLVGDRFYGGTLAANLHLVSYAVRLKHPISGVELQLSLPQRFLPKWISNY